jgi:DNA-binding response OmpR family regulator
MKPEIIKLRSIEIDTKNKIAIKEGEKMRLRKKEYDLLEFMAMNKNRVLNRLTILEYVWNYNTCISTNTLEVHVTKLRKKIEDQLNLQIQTIHGLGYRLCELT